MRSPPVDGGNPENRKVTLELRPATVPPTVAVVFTLNPRFLIAAMADGSKWIVGRLRSDAADFRAFG